VRLYRVNAGGAMVFVLGIVLGLAVSPWFFTLSGVPILIDLLWAWFELDKPWYMRGR
jgi:hypothetical protein